MHDLIIADAEGMGAEGVASLAGEVKRSLSPGRFFACHWSERRDWTARCPVESILVREMCGGIDRRGREDVEFFANLGVRLYRVAPSTPVGEAHAAVFRRAGRESVRARLKDGAVSPGGSALDTRDYAFTRDVANNMWHLYERGWRESLRGRLARLLSWHDEKVALFVGGAWTEVESSALRMESDLVPVPEKHTYAFAAPRLVLGEGAMAGGGGGGWKESLGRALAAWDGLRIVASPDVDGLMSAALLRMGGFPGARLCGFYTTRYLLIFSGFTAEDCRRALWIDHDISDPRILCVGQHLLLRHEEDRLPRRHPLSFNPNVHFGQSFEDSFKGVSATTRDKYPFGTCHMLMHLYEGGEALDSTRNLALLAHADSSFANSSRYFDSAEIWRRQMFGDSAIMRAIVHDYMNDENLGPHREAVKSLLAAGVKRVSRRHSKQALPGEWPSLEGNQSFTYASNHDKANYVAKVNRIVACLSRISAFALPPVPPVAAAISANVAKHIGPQGIGRGEFDAFMESEKVFSHAFSGVMSLSYTTLSGDLLRLFEDAP